MRTARRKPAVGRPRRPSSANAGRSPQSSPANAPTSKPVDERAGRVRPCRRRSAGRSSIAMRVRSSARPCRAPTSSRDLDDVRRACSGTGRQCSVTLMPDFGSTSSRGQPRFELGGRGRDRDEIRLDARVDRVRAVDRLLHPVEADEREPVDREVPGQEPDRPAADDRDPPEPGARAARARADAPRAADARRPARSTIGDSDPSKSTSSAVRSGLLGQRGNRCVGVDHGGTLPAWTRRPPPARPIDRERERLVALSHRIHAHPELKFEEEQSSAWTAGALSDAGLPVDAGICDLPDRVQQPGRQRPAAHRDLRRVRRAARDRPRVRAQHHRRDRGRRRARARAARRRPRHHAVGDRHAGRGGRRRQDPHARARRVRRRARGADGAPDADARTSTRGSARSRTCACSTPGRESHAAIAPELGINAADAFTVAQVAIGLLRQHLRPFDQVHGIITHGGDATNVVPAHTEGTWMARSRTLGELEQLRPRVEHCFEAGALATGATLAITDVCPPYAHMEHDHDLAELYRSNATAIGRPESRRRRGDVLDRHGQRVARDAVDPPVHRDRDRRRGEPPTRVHRGGDQRVGRSRGRAEGALAMAWTVIDAATGPLRDRLLRAARRRARLPTTTTQSTSALNGGAGVGNATTLAPLQRGLLRQRDRLAGEARSCTSPSCPSGVPGPRARLRLVRVADLLQLRAQLRGRAGRARRRSARAPSAGRGSWPGSRAAVDDVVVVAAGGARVVVVFARLHRRGGRRNRRCSCRPAATGTRRR